MDNRPIGILDSGVGGLTGLKALRAFLPDENVVYFADSGRMPYGGRPRGQIQSMTRQGLEFLNGFDVKAILVACGTISSNAEALLHEWPVPAVGVLYPPVERIRREAGSGKIAVIATEASVRSGRYRQELEKSCSGREILEIACPDFAPLIESGHINAGDPLLQDAVERYLHPLRKEHVSMVLLGCTHYGIIGEVIQDYLGPETRLVSAAESGAAALCSGLLKQKQTGGSGETRFFTSGDPAAFAATAAILLGSETGEICVEGVAPPATPVAEDR